MTLERINAGINKVDCQRYMAAVPHNALKMVRKLDRGMSPGSALAAAPKCRGCRKCSGGRGGELRRTITVVLAAKLVG